MTERHDLFDHVIFLDCLRPGKWRAQLWRNTFDRRGIIIGSAHVADVYAFTKWGAIFAGRRLATRLRTRGARWPKPHV